MSEKEKRSLVRTALCRSIVVALGSLGSSILLAQDDADQNIQEVSIIGSAEQARRVTGSAHFIGEEELKKFTYSDIQRLVRQVPGVSLQVEDGYGLRPNISIRGVATERSGRITLLEDNVLIAPAPYSAPSAYYFPTTGRMSAIEVVKGPAAITQGPYTIGGALNMVSTPIPEEFSGNVVTDFGQDATYRVHATYGGRTDSGFGFLVETHQWQSDGFQDIDRSNENSGLDVKDYTIKLSYAPQHSAHAIDLKLQYADQDSNQSYLGLTDGDFADDALRRYGISELDNITTEHEQQILRYQYQLNSDIKLTATAYNNEHARNWFKTEGIDFDGSANAQDFNRTSWSNVVNAINTGSGLAANGIAWSAAQLQAILDGSQDTAPGSIQLRANDREYYSRGVQLGASWMLNSGDVSHALDFGIRLHRDQEDRLQLNSNYSQINGKLQLDDIGILGNAGNRVQEAQALSLFVHDEISVGNWLFTPGLRYEDMDQKRTRYRDGANRTFRDQRRNETKVWLPGLGVSYQLTDQVSVIGGVHKGFTAPSNSPGVDEEVAINYELGFRYDSGATTAEAIAFVSDYENLLGECTASSGTNCVVGDAFNGDAATVAGLEVSITADFANSLNLNSATSLPLIFSYTYIDGEFDTDIADTAFFGDVSKGDPIPYLPENQFLLSLGVVQGAWASYLSASYIDEVCVRASCTLFEKTDDSLTLDLSSNYRFNDSLTFFGRIENLTSAEDIMGRQPYGARPNKDRTVAVGARISF